MKSVNSKMHLTIVEKPDAQRHGGYTYLIANGAQSYCAFKTKNGFNQFMKRANVKMELIREQQTEQYGTIKDYYLIGTIIEEGFWSLDEIPEGAIKWTGLSNGSLVDCYYLHNNEGSTFYRPNPNAKEVYKPLPLNEHIAFNKVNG